MSLIVKLLAGLVIGVLAFTLVSITREESAFDPLLLLAFCIATIATALVVSAGTNGASGTASGRTGNGPRPERTTAPGGTAREQGTVKWFNATKGFGFIIKDDGEEIFVHFRSIRGEGRRGLRDGQRVSFEVAQSDKGPQAEDVEGLD